MRLPEEVVAPLLRSKFILRGGAWVGRCNQSLPGGCPLHTPFHYHSGAVVLLTEVRLRKKYWNLHNNMVTVAVSRNRMPYGAGVTYGWVLWKSDEIEVRYAYPEVGTTYLPPRPPSGL